MTPGRTKSTTVRERGMRVRELQVLVGRLADEELDILTLLTRRVLIGQVQYGRLTAARDRRTFEVEALEEIVDGLFYVGIALVQQLVRADRCRKPSSRRPPGVGRS